LSRTVYMRPPRQLKARYIGQLTHMKKPLYGIDEAPSYWYGTCIPAFKAPPTSMTQSFLDECLLFTMPPITHSYVIAEEEMMKTVFRLHEMAGVLINEALLTGNASFAVAEQEMHSRFESTTSTEKEMSELTYAGAIIIQSNPPGTDSAVQKSYIANIAIPEQHELDFGAVRTYSGCLS
jgi:hypothetical protein